MSLKVKAVPIVAKDLKPGDLFSARGPEHWDHFQELYPGGIGQSVYIRTETATPPDQADDVIYKITIETED